MNTKLLFFLPLLALCGCMGPDDPGVEPQSGGVLYKTGLYWEEIDGKTIEISDQADNVVLTFRTIGVDKIIAEANGKNVECLLLDPIVVGEDSTQILNEPVDVTVKNGEDLCYYKQRVELHTNGEKNIVLKFRGYKYGYGWKGNYYYDRNYYRCSTTLVRK